MARFDSRVLCFVAYTRLQFDRWANYQKKHFGVFTIILKKLLIFNFSAVDVK